MHIPDGYLNLPTCATTFGIMVPVWAVAAKNLKSSFETRKVPLVALGSAFSFVLMMFNFPVPGGSSGHAVGGAILAILLGPWTAVSILSVVLAIQAFLFHDGGLTTFGANAFNMAFVLPVSSYAVYSLFADEKSRLFRKALAGALAGYLGLTLSAFTTAVMLGIQPHGVSGYAPYPLRVAIPVMVGSHLLVFSWVEGFVTALVLVWAYRNFPQGLLKSQTPRQNLGRLWLAIGALIFLSPLGLLARGTAFGEWGEGELRKFFGYVPSGIQQLSKVWIAPFAGYTLTGRSFIYGYLFSAMIGALAAALFAFVLARFLSKENKRRTRENERGQEGRKGLPNWLLEIGDTPPKNEDTHLFSRNVKNRCVSSFFFSHTLRAEEFQKRPGFLQKRDARAKVIILSLCILAAAWIKSVPILLALLGGALALGFSSQIPILWFARSVLFTMAAFSFLIALPAAFAWISPGKPWITIYPPYLIITKEGVETVGLFMLRATTAIAFSTLLSLTTSWTKLLKALQVLGVPKVFLFMVEMSYRYIFLLARLIEQMNFSREARTITPASMEGEQSWTAGRIAFLLNRSIDLSESVHMAMQARGNEGKIP